MDKMVPAMTPFMERVRKAGLTVAYGTREQNMSKWLKDLAPSPSDIKIVNTAQDRFYKHRSRQGAEGRRVSRTLIMVGWKGHGFGDLHVGRSDGCTVLYGSSSRLIRPRPAATTRRLSVSIMS